jgi:hypothetical protein
LGLVAGSVVFRDRGPRMIIDENGKERGQTAWESPRARQPRCRWSRTRGVSRTLTTRFNNAKGNCSERRRHENRKRDDPKPKCIIAGAAFGLDMSNPDLRHLPGMNLDPTEEEGGAVSQELHDIIENDRYPLSPRIPHAEGDPLQAQPTAAPFMLFLRNACRRRADDQAPNGYRSADPPY